MIGFLDINKKVQYISSDPDTINNIKKLNKILYDSLEYSQNSSSIPEPSDNRILIVNTAQQIRDSNYLFSTALTENRQLSIKFPII